MERSDAAETWEILSSAIDEIYNRNASQLSFEELYRTGYTLVLHKHGALLYEGVSAKIQQHLMVAVTNELQVLSSTTSSSAGTTTSTTNSISATTEIGKSGAGASSYTSNMLFLEAVADAWHQHTVTMSMIRDILMYMDRTFVVQQKRRPVFELGLHLFRVTVWEHPTIRSTVIDLVLEAIALERCGHLLDDRGASAKQIIGMLLELGRADYAVMVYQEDFERIFLGRTQEFYHSESLQYLSEATASDYVRKAVRRIEEEKIRAINLQLPQTTTGPLQSIVQTEWIERHAVQLVDMESTGFAALLQQAGTNPGTIVGVGPASATTATATSSKATAASSSISDDKILNDMREMYELFVRVPASVDYLRDALSERIKTTGRQLIHDQMTGQADPAAFVRGVLHMRQQYETVVQVAFGNEKKAQKRMKESFEDFLNVDARAASCLAVYVDELLRTGLRGATDEQVNDELHKVIVVFRYLSDKDIFESFYKQHLAKRLLGNRSVSDDAERATVSLLKAECGYQYTTKLEGMFNDMRISRETRDKYKAHKRQQQESSSKSSPSKSSSIDYYPSSILDIEVDVLTTGYWPSQNVPPCTLPVVVQDAIDQFSKFYLEKHTGRKLSWQTSAGAAELRATFGVGSGKPLRHHELSVSTYQMCILLLFNTTDTLTLAQIRAHTHVPDAELRRHLISLCTPKNRILKKGSKGRSIDSDTDTFTFNNDYTSKSKRVKIQLVKETSITSSTTGQQQQQQQLQRQQQNAGDDSNHVGPGSSGGNGVSVGAQIVTNSGGDNDGTMVIDGSVPVAVEEDRRHLVEAAIVRIMKARRSLNHNDLIAEVTKQLSVRFNPSPTFIKKRIESLIDREYLERDEHEHRRYLYVA
jgi:cullin 3